MKLKIIIDCVAFGADRKRGETVEVPAERTAEARYLLGNGMAEIVTEKEKKGKKSESF